MNFFRKNVAKDGHLKTGVFVARHSADRALEKYAKTFTDLARYDRGEIVDDVKK